jgi:hypothetical protein
MILTVETERLRKICTSATLSTTNPAPTALGDATHYFPVLKGNSELQLTFQRELEERQSHKIPN